MKRDDASEARVGRFGWKYPPRAGLAVFLAAAIFLGLGDCSRRKSLGDLLIDHPTPLQWTKLEPGFEFTRLSFTRRSDQGKVVLAALRIVPARYRFDLISSVKLTGGPLSSLAELTRRTHPLAAVNASFFREDNSEPIGLAVARGKLLHPFQKTGGSGVFRVADGKASLAWAKDYNEKWRRDDLALQAGPMLIEPGPNPGIRRHAEKYRSRTAVGLDEIHRVVVVCTYRKDESGLDLSGLDLYELMEIMLLPEPEGGLGLQAALNLDGGTSTAMSVNHHKLQLEIPSLQPIANALAIYPP